MTSNCGARSLVAPVRDRLNGVAARARYRPTTLSPPRPVTGWPLSRHSRVNRWNSKSETFVMPQQMIWFFVSIAFSFIAWGSSPLDISGRNSTSCRGSKHAALLILHIFASSGWHCSFLASYLRSAPTFAHYAAYGDIIAAILALVRCYAAQCGWTLPPHGSSTFWVSADLLNVFYQGNHTGLLVGQLGPHSSFRLSLCRCC